MTTDVIKLTDNQLIMATLAVLLRNSKVPVGAEGQSFLNVADELADRVRRQTGQHYPYDESRQRMD